MSATIVTNQSSLLDTVLELSAANVDAMLSSFPAIGSMSNSPQMNERAVTDILESTQSSLSNVIVHEHNSFRRVDEFVRIAAFVASLGLLAAIALSAVYL